MGSRWEGEVTAVGETGNLVTNIPTSDLLPFLKNSKVWFEFGTHEKHFSVRELNHSISEVEKGRLLALGGPSGFVEIAVREASAAEMTGVQIGGCVTLSFRI